MMKRQNGGRSGRFCQGGIMKKLAFLLVAAAVAVSPVMADAKAKKSKEAAEAEDIARQHDNTKRALIDSLPLWLPTWSLPVYFNMNKNEPEKKKKHKATTVAH
jgi:cell division septation protein DedD